MIPSQMAPLYWSLQSGMNVLMTIRGSHQGDCPEALIAHSGLTIVADGARTQVMEIPLISIPWIFQ